MNYLSWNDEMPEGISPDTGAILAQRKEAAKEKTEGSVEPHFPQWAHAEQQGKSSLAESSTLHTRVRDLLQENVEQYLRSVGELEEAAMAGSRKAMFELQEIALWDRADDVRVAAVEALGTLGEQMPVVPLLLALHDSFWDVRAAAAQALGKLGKRTPIRHLVAHLKREPDMSVREAIVRVLGQQGKVMPVNTLIHVLQTDESWLVREAAAWALGELGECAPLHALIYALRFDPSEQVRAAAATSLGQVGGQEVMGPLFKALEVDDGDVQGAASLALQQLDKGTESQEAFGNLEGDDLSFLEEWLSSDMSLSEERQRQKEWRAFSTLTEYIKDKKGGVKAELKETTRGRVLLFHCFYKCAEKSLQETLLPSIKEVSVVEPIEAALQSRDDLVLSAVKKALETGKKREWFDLLVVSFVILHTQEETEWEPPLRVIVCSMSCQNVREQDVLVLDQLLERWLDTVNEPLVCERSHDLAQLKVWYQSAADSFAVCDT